MINYLLKKYYGLLSLGVLVFAGGALLSRYYFLNRGMSSLEIGLLILLVGGLMTGAVVKKNQRLRDDLNLLYDQLQHFQSIVSIIQPRQALPAFRGWSVSPDFMVGVMNDVLTEEPELVVECGSGTSSLVVGYLLEKIGHGQLVSLEHSREHYEQTDRLVKSHGLKGVVDVRYAPLQDVAIGEQNWEWYDPDRLDDLRGVDLVIVDGPLTGSLAEKTGRYPALPFFDERLADDAIVYLDDVKHRRTHRVFQEWTQAFDDYRYELIDTEDGMGKVSCSPARPDS